MTRIPDTDRPLSEQELARQLGVSVRLLRRYERVGLIRAERSEALVVYGPEQVRRAWSVVTLHRDLGVNLAGVEIILEMSEQLRGLRQQMAELLRWLHEHREVLRRALDEDMGRTPR